MAPKIARIPNLLSYTTKYMMASRPEKKKYKRRRSISLSESFTLVGFWQRLEGGLCVWLSNSEWVSFVCVCVCVHFLLFFWKGLDGRRSFYKGRANSPVSWRVSRHFLFGASHNLNLCWQQLLLLLPRKRGAVGNRLGPSLRHWVVDSIRLRGENDDRN
jgi:hypothetical protein